MVTVSKGVRSFHNIAREIGPIVLSLLTHARAASARAVDGYYQFAAASETVTDE